MMMMLCVYLSGPISGKNFDQATRWRQAAGEQLRAAGFRVLDPMRGGSFLSSQRLMRPEENVASYQEALLSDKALVRRDKLDVLTADIILVYLMEADVASIGTIYEMAWAEDHNKLVVIAINDHNVHDHSFVRESGVFFPALGLALDYIVSCGVEELPDALREPAAS